MLYLKSKEDAKVYIGGVYKGVSKGEVFGVSPSTYFILQSKKDFIPLSSEFVRGTWMFKLIAPSDGSIALSGKKTEYTKGDILNVPMPLVRSYFLKGFVGYSEELSLEDEVSEEEVIEEVVEGTIQEVPTDTTQITIESVEELPIEKDESKEVVAPIQEVVVRKKTKKNKNK